MPVRKIRRRPKIFSTSLMKKRTLRRKKGTTIRRPRQTPSSKSKANPKTKPKPQQPKTKAPQPPPPQSRNIPPLPQQSDNKSQNISVIIPCANEDAHLLVNLIHILKYQTLLPKEIIISLSGKKYLRPETLKNVEALSVLPLPFAIKILYHNDKVWASGNKNFAAAVATGDILIVQDSDDIPHFQRFEIIKYFMEKYDAVHIGHGFTERRSKDAILASAYQRHPFNTRYHIPSISYYIVTPENQPRYFITNGEIGLLRSIWNKHKWDNNLRIGEDTTYNRNIERRYGKTVYVTKPLILYNRVPQHF